MKPSIRGVGSNQYADKPPTTPVAATVAAPGASAVLDDPFADDVEPLTMTVAHRTQRTEHYGATYGQDVEPAGRYVVQVDPGFEDRMREDGWDVADITFDKPYIMPFGSKLYTDPDNWKQALSREYGGLTGEDLSRAMAADGWDAIVTHDKYGTSEIVDLTMFGNDTAAAPTPPTRDNLSRRLLGLGGTQAVLPSIEEDLAKLLERGEHRDCPADVLTEGDPSQCHANTASLYSQHGGTIITGYALSEDGAWRQHSWWEDPDGVVVETTVERTAYYGVRLTEDEAADFVFWNW